MATIYNIKFGTSSGGNVVMTLGPHDDGSSPRYFGEFHLETEEPKRNDSVVIAYADGVKDTSDGKRAEGTVVVAGWLHYTSVDIADLTAYAMAAILRDLRDFYIWKDYSGSPGKIHQVRKSISHHVTDVEGWGGERIGVSMTFAVHEYAD